MRLSDAGLRRRQTKLIYTDHRLPPWLAEDPTPRSLVPASGGTVARQNCNWYKTGIASNQA